MLLSIKYRLVKHIQMKQSIHTCRTCVHNGSGGGSWFLFLGNTALVLRAEFHACCQGRCITLMCPRRWSLKAVQMLLWWGMDQAHSHGSGVPHGMATCLLPCLCSPHWQRTFCFWLEYVNEDAPGRMSRD